MEDLPFGEGVHQSRRDDVEQEIGGGGHFARAGIGGEAFGIERRGIDVHAGARLEQVDDGQSDQERQRADGLEIGQRQAAGFADLFHVLHAGDSGHHGAENHRGDDHFDQLDEAVAQGFHRGSSLRRKTA